MASHFWGISGSVYRIAWLAAGYIFVLALILLLTHRQTVAAQTEGDTAEIDAYVLEQMEQLKIPGAAIGIVRGTEVVYVQGYGVADDAGRSMTPRTPFLVASFSKSFTALGVMQLAEAGKIDLDTPLQTYLPWFEMAEKESSARITIRQLLYQTSGLSEDAGDQRNLEANLADDALETSLRKLKEQQLSTPPGTRFEYSNTNYDLLGMLIQTVSGQSYETYIQENIFTPLGMINSYTSLVDARTGNLTRGYYPLFGFPVAWDEYMPYSRGVLPSTGLFSSAEDMARYLAAQLNQGVYHGNSILSPEGMAELHTQGVQFSDNAGYAMGWTVFGFPQAAGEAPGEQEPTGISHGGRWIGYRALMVFVPERKVGMVLLMNKSDPSRENAMDNIGFSLALLALGLEPLQPPEVDFFIKYWRAVVAMVILLLVLGLVWAVRKLRSFSAQARGDGQQKRKLALQTVLLAGLDLALAATLWFYVLPQDYVTLPLAFGFGPDIGIMYVLVLVLTLGWGTLRTILFVRQLGKAKLTPGG